ncbi:divergent PAP2 family protein [Desulfitobacterium sp.]|uniref:divergent PAP2 family protein n=1 Tax=Desulfitobacterium sp. TaxID=49981 RepID=UPI002BF9966B|nr:divergent PAP2 family protein [Desulfitobacterium sp.]HVJ47873.1 divergent PAP2 family protein [Desulfitobacterium sp.]
MTIFPGIFHNTILISAITAWLVAQIIKVVINFMVHRTFDLYFLISSGGFPSSHAATVSALSLGIGKYYGWDSPIFAVATVFALIVMYDAAGVRREAGKQAEVINQLVAGLYSQMSDLSQERLKELIGHTPFEVFAGTIVGIIVGIIV